LELAIPIKNPGGFKASSVVKERLASMVSQDITLSVLLQTATTRNLATRKLAQQWDY
jgi:hypothetical protein